MPLKRVVLITLLGAAIGTAACGGIESATQPNAPLPAYSEWTPSSTSARLSGGDWGDSHKSSCNPLSPRTVAQDIGPRGGVLHIGPHALTVLPGSLLRITHITGTISADSVNSVQFAPEGLRFAVPAILSLSYANCKLPPLGTMKVVYTSNDLLTLLELVRSIDNKGNRSVVGFIGHFSRYAVAY